jgi:NAD(P)-dependent dehydrogenase (short-subunit alcohol dehydrogenase family)
VTAPAILINKFLHKHAKTGKRLMVCELADTPPAGCISFALVEQHAHFLKSAQWINISSGAAQKDLDGRSVYCTSKAAAEMFIKCCATEARVKGDNDRVRFFSIAPGVVDTDMQTVMREQGKAKGTVRIAMRNPQPTIFVGGFVFLRSCYGVRDIEKQRRKKRERDPCETRNMFSVFVYIESENRGQIPEKPVNGRSS